MNIIKANLQFKNPLIPLKLDKVVYIVIHHIDKFNATPEEIHQWHLEYGWNGFGYNEYIRKDGTVVIGRGDNIGAHCENMNSKSYGIALEGDYDNEQVIPAEQYKSLLNRLNYHKLRFKNLIDIVGHNKLYQTSCPGKFVSVDVIKKDLALYDVEFETALDVLVDNGVIISPDYWRQNINGQVKGEYVKKLIKNFANKSK
jgi:hypothetical protein